MQKDRWFCRTIASAGVNNDLRHVSGSDFIAKDFRTCAGTIVATNALQELGACEIQTQAKKNVGLAIDVAAAYLGNTKAICRKYYAHPGVIDAYLEGTLLTGRVDYRKGIMRKNQEPGLVPKK